MAARRHKTDSTNGEKLTRHRLRDPTGPARWAALRRMGRAWQSGKKRGEGEACTAALALVRKLTLECGQCGALVDWRRAKTAMRNAKGKKRNRGCGCAGRRCTKYWAPKKFGKTQRKMAAALRSGERILAAWPRNADDADIWQRPAGATRRVTARAEDA